MEQREGQGLRLGNVSDMRLNGPCRGIIWHEIKRTIKELLRQSIPEGMGRGKQQELRPKTRTSLLSVPDY